MCGCGCSIRIMAVNIYFVGADLGTSAKCRKGLLTCGVSNFNSKYQRQLQFFQGLEFYIEIRYKN